MSKTVIAILFDNCGPYHLARIRAASQGLVFLGIQLVGKSETYQWKTPDQPKGMEIDTLFPGGGAPSLAAMFSRLEVSLQRNSPYAVAVPGWSSPLALMALKWCQAHGVPAIVMSESTQWDEPRSFWKEWIKKRVVSLFSAGLAGGNPHRDYLVQLGMPAERIFLGYDAVDNEYFAARSAEVRERRSEVGGQKSEVRSPKTEDRGRRTEDGEQRTGGGAGGSGEGQWANPKSEIRNPNGELNRERRELGERGGARLPERFFLASARFVEKKNLPRLIQAYGRYREMGGGFEAEIRNPKSEAPGTELNREIGETRERGEEKGEAQRAKGLKDEGTGGGEVRGQKSEVGNPKGEFNRERRADSTGESLTPALSHPMGEGVERRQPEVGGQRSEVGNPKGELNRERRADSTGETLTPALSHPMGEGVGQRWPEVGGQRSEVGAGLWDLVILGDGPLKPELCRLIAELGLESCVHLPGFVQYPDLPQYYGCASAFIHASTTEQWGLVVNEAMASGLPVLVSKRCGCAQDLVQEGVNGYTFDPYNVEEMASLMQRTASAEAGVQRSEIGGQRANPLQSPLATHHSPLTTHHSAMGLASQRIIADWGTERFADGLVKAVEAAKAGPLPKPSWLDRLLLWSLIRFR